MSVKKKIETPDGRTLNIEAPDDATDDEVIEFVESELQKEELARDKKVIQAAIDGQNKALDILTEMAKLMLTLTARIDAIDKRKMPAPVVHVSPAAKGDAPVVNVMPDPAVAEAMREMSRMNDETLKKIIESLVVMGESMTQVKHSDAGEMEFQVIPVHDQRSGRFGRIDKVRVVKATN